MKKAGITRKKKRASGKKITWEYFDARGKRITNQKVIDRCNKLALPPAWASVWISTDADADLQGGNRDLAHGSISFPYLAGRPLP